MGEKLKKFRVSVSRIIYESSSFVIEAEDAETAFDLAEDRLEELSETLEWNEWRNCEDCVEEVEEI